MANKLFKIYAAGMIATAVVGLGAVLLIPKLSREYSSGLSLACRTVQQPEREEWNDLCLRRNSQHIDQKLFETIEQKRTQKLNTNGCDPDQEHWYCILDHQTGRYQPLFFGQ
ncbi:hypothetical protein J4479_01020 [Candidatus Woesearchaeota archaeon]|nr:hypothetical protein [Candidatus Woesearchaeota archaeon]